MIYDILFGKPVLIYQMPKAGSQTVEATLRTDPVAPAVLRFHYLSSTMAGILRKGLLTEYSNPQWKRDAQLQLRLMRKLNLAIRGRMLLRRCGVRLTKLQVITGLREPIALALASLFENYFHRFPTGPAALEICREALLKPKTLKYIQEWFDLELGPTLGLDVYRYGFDPETGYEIYENDSTRVLLYRFEALAQLPEMLHEFLGQRFSKVVRCNLGVSKRYAEQYQFVKQHLRLPDELVAAQYESRMMRHFYTEAERAEFRQRWTDVEVPAILAMAA
jgi:Putative capsular polysaccharide synthesis protein